MSKELDRGRLKLELQRVQMATASLEYNVLEQEDVIIRANANIQRLRESIEIQKKAETDLIKRIEKEFTTN